MVARLALVLAVVAGACGQKKPDDKPTDKAEGIETSYTGYVSKTYPGDLAACVNATKTALHRRPGATVEARPRRPSAQQSTGALDGLARSYAAPTARRDAGSRREAQCRATLTLQRGALKCLQTTT